MNDPPSTVLPGTPGPAALPGRSATADDQRGGPGITVCVVDCLHGRPADGVAFSVQRKLDGEWRDQGHGHTDEGGGLVGVLGEPATTGVYRIEFDVDGYFASLGMVAFHPTVTVVFRLLDPAQRYHMPILITPFSHSTYRSS